MYNDSSIKCFSQVDQPPARAGAIAQPKHEKVTSPTSATCASTRVLVAFVDTQVTNSSYIPTPLCHLDQQATFVHMTKVVEDSTYLPARLELLKRVGRWWGSCTQQHYPHQGRHGLILHLEAMSRC